MGGETTLAAIIPQSRFIDAQHNLVVISSAAITITTFDKGLRKVHQRIGLLPKESVCFTRRLRIRRQRSRGDLNCFHDQRACFFRPPHNSTSCYRYRVRVAAGLGSDAPN
ncbi:MAG: hypothetical protein ACJARY_001705 [Candidatus Azotimanducaceae bacterium]|jgi:hypothetical protein